eukprot:tig00000042_g15598.t1
MHIYGPFRDVDQSGSPNDFVVIPVTGVLTAGQQVVVYIVNPGGVKKAATSVSVENSGSAVVLKFRAPQLRRNILQFAVNQDVSPFNFNFVSIPDVQLYVYIAKQYDLRIESPTGASAPIVIAKACL